MAGVWRLAEERWRMREGALLRSMGCSVATEPLRMLLYTLHLSGHHF